MRIHDIYARISPRFRHRRFQQFVARTEASADDTILDVGGYPETWTPHPPYGARVDVLNIHPIDFDASRFPQHSIETIVGNGCDLKVPDGTYDIVHSNSVIEHLGTWENQVRFAQEVRRVGHRLWIQTPAKEFFIETHFVAPFVHWFPKNVRRRLLRWFTIWGWTEKPSKEKIDSVIEEIRLLTLAEMKQLFPDCDIIKEKFLGVFTKSYIAFRNG